MYGLSRLSNCRVKSTNLYLKVGRCNAVQKGRRKDGKSSTKKGSSEVQQGVYVKNLTM